MYAIWYCYSIYVLTYILEHKLIQQVTAVLFSNLRMSLELCWFQPRDELLYFVLGSNKCKEECFP